MNSIWCDYSNGQIIKKNNSLEGNIYTDVLIIGGGITGLLCSYKLNQLGIDNIVVDAGKIFGSTSQNTTGKITAQHRLIYSKIVNTWNVELAKLYYKANKNAINDLKELSLKYPCDFENKTAYVYSTDNRKALENEAYIYEQIGIKYEFLEKTNLPIHTISALGMYNQGQFNPVKFLEGISKKIRYYENTPIIEIKNNEAISGKGNITARKIILSTHYPIINVPGFYFMKLYQERSYLLALKSDINIDGMYIDERKSGYSFRNYDKYLMIGGCSHRTGKNSNNLEKFASSVKNFYPNSKIKYIWASQDCMSLDNLPYIGVHRKGKSNIYVATGFNKWGMTTSMIAATLLTDLIVNEKSEYEKLFSPQRSMIKPQLFINMKESLVSLLKWGKRCPHMGCRLTWNSIEKTWDCPCHGSRFDKEGSIINNPAKRRMKLD